MRVVNLIFLMVLAAGGALVAGLAPAPAVAGPGMTDAQIEREIERTTKVLEELNDAAETADDSEKTEKATPKRREDARKKGDVPQSRDITSVVGLIAIFAISVIYNFIMGIGYYWGYIPGAVIILICLLYIKKMSWHVL